MRRTRIRTWARRDPEDDRTIHYTIKDECGKVHKFTSLDTIEPSLFHKCVWAWIDKIELINNEWHIAGHVE